MPKDPYPEITGMFRGATPGVINDLAVVLDYLSDSNVEMPRAARSFLNSRLYEAWNTLERINGEADDLIREYRANQ